MMQAAKKVSKSNVKSPRRPQPVGDQKPARIGFDRGDSSSLEAFEKLDRLRRRFPRYLWWKSPETPELAVAFSEVRNEAGWNAFVNALHICDTAVNTLLEENITDWSSAKSKIQPVNKARNAWRRACTFGIQPPDLPIGFASFTEQGMRFHVHVLNSRSGVLVVRSARNQVLGMFNLRLAGGGGQHIISHMLENALRYPDYYLSYPWDIVMATDTIHVPDIDVWIDRINGEATITSPGTPGGGEKRK